MKQVLLVLILLLFVHHSICPTLYEVQASKNCKLYSKKDNKTCSEWSISFKNIITNLQVDQLVHQYHKTFGKYECDFFISTFDRENQNTEYCSWCYDTKLGSIAVEGQFFDSQNRYFALFDRKSQKQQLVTIGLTEKLRSLDGTESSDDDVVYKNMKKMNRSFTRENLHKTIYFDKPTIELAVTVDDFFFNFMDGDKELIQMTIHKILNGVNAIYKHVNISVKYSAHHKIGSEMTTKLSEGCANYFDYVENLTRYHENVIFEDQGSGMEESKLSGLPDMTFTITKLKVPHYIFGQMYIGSVCSSSAHGVIIVRDDYIPGTLFPHMAFITAHEMAHSLGIEHIDPLSNCNCKFLRGVCVMQNGFTTKDQALISGQWSDCTRDEIKKVINQFSEEKNCLFTKDFFTGQEVDQGKYSKAAVELKATFSASDNLMMSLKSPLFEHQSLKLHKSFNVQLPNGHVCSFYHNRPGQQFAAFHWCGSTANNSHWSGVFHLPEMTVQLYFNHKRGVYGAYRYAIPSINTPDVILPNQTKKFEIDVYVVIRSDFTENFKSKISRNSDNLFPFILGAINMADALFRLNGIRIRVKGMTNEVVTLNSTVLSSTIALTFSDCCLPPWIILNRHALRGCGQAMKVHWNPFQKDQQMLAIDVAHTIGHQLGLKDRPQNECGCLTRQGLCFMYEELGENIGFVWSACDAEKLKNLTDSCHQFLKVMQRRVKSHQQSILTLTLIIGAELIFMLLLVIGNVFGLIHPLI